MISAVHLQRRKQINTLHIFNENVQEIQPDLEYRLCFTVLEHFMLTMVILLPPDFPNGRSKPLIRIIPTIHNHSTLGQNSSVHPEATKNLSHPWLSSDNVVIGSPGLNNFGLHSDLGRVVQAIKREFERNPPKFLDVKTIQNGHTTAKSGKLEHPGEAKVLQANNQMGVVPRTKSKNIIPEIESLSRPELEAIQSDPLAFNVFCRQLKVSMFTSMEEQSQNLKEEIKSISQVNAELTKELETKQQIFKDKKVELEQARSEALSKATSLRESAGALNKSQICDNLLIASHSDETESEKCAEKFLSGDMGLEDFLTKYIDKRAKHHERKIKHEKLRQQQS